MLYYYAHSGHKVGLDRVRRGVAMLKSLIDEGVECCILVNDFRAGLACRELGLKEYITIETIQDIDAVAKVGDSIIIDSLEDDHGRLVKFCSDFKQVWRFGHDKDDKPIHSEIVIPYDTVVIDSQYLKESPKEDRVLLFLADMDFDKTIINNQAFFKSIDMELVLGNYFFVKYEDELAKIFSTLHEPEDYTDLIQSSSQVITASSQVAIEAKASGADVIFLNIQKSNTYSIDSLTEYGISIIDGLDIDTVKMNLSDKLGKVNKDIREFDNKKIINNL